VLNNTLFGQRLCVVSEGDEINDNSAETHQLIIGMGDIYSPAVTPAVYQSERHRLYCKATLRSLSLHCAH